MIASSSMMDRLYFPLFGLICLALLSFVRFDCFLYSNVDGSHWLLGSSTNQALTYEIRGLFHNWFNISIWMKLKPILKVIRVLQIAIRVSSIYLSGVLDFYWMFYQCTIKMMWFNSHRSKKITKWIRRTF